MTYLLSVYNTTKTTNFTKWDEAWQVHLQDWREYPATLGIFCFIMAVLSVLGTLANIFVVASFLIIEELRKIRFVFIVNLAVTDLSITAIVMPFNILSTVYGVTFYKGRDWLCDFIGSICATACATSVWSLLAIAMERYVFVCHYSFHQRIFTIRKSIAMLALVWFVAHLIHLPNFVGWGHTGYAKDFHLCTGELGVWSYSAFWAIFSVLLPVNVSFYAYLKIYLRVRKSTSGRKQITGGRKQHNVQPEQQTGDQLTVERTAAVKGEIRMIKALFQVFIIFVVSWLPVGILFTINNGYSAPKWVNLAALVLAHGNSASNAFVFLWLNQHIRSSCLSCTRLYRKCCRKFKVSPVPSFAGNFSFSRNHTMESQRRNTINTSTTPSLKK